MYGKHSERDVEGVVVIKVLGVWRVMDALCAGVVVFCLREWEEA
jgi:hypothetical protein